MTRRWRQNEYASTLSWLDEAVLSGNRNFRQAPGSMDKPLTYRHRYRNPQLLSVIAAQRLLNLAVGFNPRQATEQTRVA